MGSTVVGAAVAMEVPPGDAVGDEGDGGLGTEQRGDGGRDGGECGSFDGNDHHVLWAEAGGVRLGGNADVDGAVRHGDLKAMGLNGGEVGASSDQGGFVALRLGEMAL